MIINKLRGMELVLTRDDLEQAEHVVYDKVLSKLNNPSPDQLRMLSVYSYAATELRKAVEIVKDKGLAAHLRRCLVYARNGLGLWNPMPIDPGELLLDCKGDWPPVYLYLDPAWEVKPGGAG